MTVVRGQPGGRPAEPPADGRGPDEPGASLVGRREELASIAAAIERIRIGHGIILLISGEAGIGKSRLAATATELATLAGLLGITARAIEGDWQPPYRLWADVLGEAIARTTPPSTATPPGWVAPLLAVVPELARRFPAARPLAGLGPSEERFRLADAVGDCLRDLVAHRPLLITLDDIQWADPETLALLRHISHTIHALPLVLLVLVRNDYLDQGGPLTETVATMRRAPGFTEISLGGLPERDVAALAGAVAGEPVPAETVREIAAGTHGNPFFIQELTRHLHANGTLTTPGAGGPTGSVPPSLRQVVDQRLARLTPETRRALRLAAVCTDGFGFRVLSSLTGIADDALLDVLDEALAAHLLVAVDGPDDRYDFRHALIRRALYDSWSPSRRVRLHRQLAESLERIHGDGATTHAAEIATHYHVSLGLPGADRGIRYALAAAQVVGRLVAPEQAAMWLRVARDLAADQPPDRLAPIVTDLGVAEANAFLMGDALVTIDQALDLHRRAGIAPGETARFLADVVTALHDGGASPSDWLPLVHRGLALTPPDDELTWARLTLLIPRWEAIASGAVNGARWLGSNQRAVAIARASGDERLFARSMQPWDLWDRELTESLTEQIQTWREPEAIIRALTISGADWLYHQGDFRRARAHFEHLLAVSDRARSIHGQAEATVRLALIQTALGDLPAARSMRDRARELVSRLGPGHRLHASFNWVVAMQAEVGEGGWSGVADYFTALVADPTLIRRTAGIDDAALAGLALARAGRPNEARRVLVQLATVVAGADPTMWLFNGVVSYGAAAVAAIGEPALAAPFRDGARALIAAGHDDFPGGSSHLSLARMGVLLGDAPGATAAFAAARDHLDRSGQRPLRATVDLEEAVWLRAGNREPGRVAELATAARDAFLALGMADHAARAADLLPASPATAPTHDASGLTEREIEVVRLIAQGLADRQVGDALFVSPRTVHAHVRNILAKTGLANRTELSVWAVSRGLVSRPERRDG